MLRGKSHGMILLLKIWRCSFCTCLNAPKLDEDDRWLFDSWRGNGLLSSDPTVLYIVTFNSNQILTAVAWVFKKNFLSNLTSLIYRLLIQLFLQTPTPNSSFLTGKAGDDLSDVSRELEVDGSSYTNKRIISERSEPSQEWVTPI